MSSAREKSVAAQIHAMESLTVNELRAEYERLFGEPTKARNRKWLFRGCAWRIQELAFGGLSERAKQRAKELARDCDVRPRGGKADAIVNAAAGKKVVPFQPAPVSDTPLPGTVLTREYKGETIQVRVLDGAFEYQGQVYRSLTAVARAVTGSHWNGRAFFGLKKGAKR